MKIVTGLMVILGFGCGSTQSRTSTATSSNAAGPLVADQSCPTSVEGLALRLPRPEGYQFAAERHGCMVFAGASPQQASLMVRADALGTDDAGPEQQLNTEPDGASRWLLATGMLGGSAQALPEGGEVTLLGTAGRYFRVSGELRGLGPREVAVTRLRRGSANVVVMAVYPVGDAAKLAEGLRIMAAITAP